LSLLNYIIRNVASQNRVGLLLDYRLITK